MQENGSQETPTYKVFIQVPKTQNKIYINKFTTRERARQEGWINKVKIMGWVTEGQQTNQHQQGKRQDLYTEGTNEMQVWKIREKNKKKK